MIIVYMRENGSMSYNTDGFNERSIYIHNSNDLNRISSDGPDNSVAKMRSEERRNIVETTNSDTVIVPEEIRGSKDNFLIRNEAINNANKKPTPGNPVMQAMRNNLFKK